MNIKISIITVCYNSEKTIVDTINSVKNQTYNNYEHIIIDGKSTDKTLDIIKKYSEISNKVRYISESDKGIYNAMNKGILLAEGDLIVFLNSDDTFEKNALELINDNYDENIDIIYGDVYWIEKYKEKIFEKKLNINHDNIVQKMEMPPHNSTFVRSEIMKKNLFDENMKICSDYKFFLNMYKQNRRFKHINYRLTNMLMGGVSTTQLEKGLYEHIKCQIDVFGYSNIDRQKRKKEINRMIKLKKISKKILPSRLYIKLRYINKGWHLKCI